MGKSSLVAAALKANAQGYWAVGKCNNVSQAAPYAPWVEILSALTTQLLAKDSHELDALRHDILRRIQGHGRLLGKLAPDLQLVLGALPPLPGKLTPMALQKELRAVVEFLAVLSRPGLPLVLFIDDIQWVDEASRQLLAQLLANAPGNLLLIFAQRSDTGTTQGPASVPHTAQHHPEPAPAGRWRGGRVDRRALPRGCRSRLGTGCTGT